MLTLKSQSVVSAVTVAIEVILGAFIFICEIKVLLCCAVFVFHYQYVYCNFESEGLSKQVTGLA